MADLLNLNHCTAWKRSAPRKRQPMAVENAARTKNFAGF
jgi:hypothetical protein